jgi:hypothetical protein
MNLSPVVLSVSTLHILLLFDERLAVYYRSSPFSSWYRSLQEVSYFERIQDLKSNANPALSASRELWRMTSFAPTASKPPDQRCRTLTASS